jgi:hypothetical protein
MDLTTWASAEGIALDHRRPFAALDPLDFCGVP